MDALDFVDLVRHGMVRFRLPDGPVVYVDPFQLEKAHHDADLIVVTHSHSDHFPRRTCAGPPGRTPASR